MEDTNAWTIRDQAEGHRALLELEAKFNKKPRSAALSIQGSQIQTLTGFIRIFEQYPYPVVINAAILKLADWFRTFNNSVKFYVYKVFKEASDLHLAKVINVEETVRRILPILGSNDPIARATTLRVLGCMSMIIAEKLDVQYGIIQRLELATDRIELEAAIWAGDQICARSSRFPSVIFSKISDKLEHPDTPFDVKLRLVKIFRHMHQDIAMAREAKLACLNLLANPDTDSRLVVVTIRTLTLLLSEAVIDRKEQIDRLLDYALNDEREDVCFNVLYDLVLLGKHDIMFDETHIVRLLKVVVSMKQSNRTKQRAFKCAQSLFESHQKLIGHLILNDTPELQEFTRYVFQCEQILLDAILNKQYTFIVACGRLLFTIIRIIVSQKVDKDQMDVDIPIRIQIQDLALNISNHISKVYITVIEDQNISRSLKKIYLREVLKVTSHFCLLLKDWDYSTSFKEAYNLLTNADDETSICLLPYLSSISVKCNDLSAWFPEKATHELQKRIDDAPVFMNLVRLLIRTTQASHALTSQIASLLYLFGKWEEETKIFYKNGWNIYLIGMEAGSCGWYELMHIVMRDLCNKVETEASRYWLKSLSTLALSECNLAKQDKMLVQGQGYISDVNDNFIKTLTQFKAFQALEQPRVTQSWFIQLRMEMIIALQNTLYTLDKMTSNDTASTSMVMKRENKQLQQAAVTFRRLAFRYDFIAQSYFGIDKETLDVTEAYKTCALVCEHAARTFLRSGFFCIDPSLIPLINKTSDDDLATQNLASKKHANDLIHNCKDFIDIITKWEEYDHLEEKDRRVTCGHDMRSIFQSILGQPLIIPKPFFKNRRNVSVQLTTDPPISEQKPITLQLNEGLVIKFEGLLQMNQGIKNLEKKIKKAVIISFLTKERMAHLDDRMGVHMMFAEPLQIFNPNDEESILLQPPTVYLANIRNSYFTYTGLITLPRNALPNTKREAWINIFVKLLDDNSGTWSVGPQLSGRLVW